MKRCDKDYSRGYARGLRMALIYVLGGKCQRCGVTDKRVLTVDHPKNDGAEHRRTAGAGTAYYRSLLRRLLKEKYNLLCANCNARRKLPFTKGSK